MSAMCSPAVRPPAQDDSDRHAKQTKADLITIQALVVVIFAQFGGWAVIMTMLMWVLGTLAAFYFLVRFSFSWLLRKPRGK
jgi:hypothetical protein